MFTQLNVFSHPAIHNKSKNQSGCVYTYSSLYILFDNLFRVLKISIIYSFHNKSNLIWQIYANDITLMHTIENQQRIKSLNFNSQCLPNNWKFIILPSRLIGFSNQQFLWINNQRKRNSELFFISYLEGEWKKTKKQQRKHNV